MTNLAVQHLIEEARERLSETGNGDYCAEDAVEDDKRYKLGGDLPKNLQDSNDLSSEREGSGRASCSEAIVGAQQKGPHRQDLVEGGHHDCCRAACEGGDVIADALQKRRGRRRHNGQVSGAVRELADGSGVRRCSPKKSIGGGCQKGNLLPPFPPWSVAKAPARISMMQGSPGRGCRCHRCPS